MMADGVLIQVAPFVPIRGLFTYRVSVDDGEAPPAGCRVLVPFGKRQVVGIVVGPTDAEAAPRERVRTVAAILDSQPALPAELLEFLLWAGAYYYAPEGEMIRAAVPTVLHAKQRQVLRLTDEGKAVLKAQQQVLRRPDLDVSGDGLVWLLDLEARGGSIERKPTQVSGRRGAALRQLIARGWVSESVRRREARLPTDLLIETLNPDDAEASLRRAPRQRALWENVQAAGGAVPLSQLEDAPPDVRALLRKLASKDLVALREIEGRRRAFADEPILEDPSHTLTSEQQLAFDTLRAAVARSTFEAFLLHGVTGSGKTEVYLRLIADALDRGRTALVLVPEIALTPQLAARFRARFGDDVAVLHSGLKDNDRYDEWMRIRQGRVRIAVGARSAIFAPLENLGVLIVDEEHDGSFKQEEGVRYNARDLALVRAKRVQAVVVLGSATPSLESYRGVEQGRLELLRLQLRPTPRPLPEVAIIDLRVHRAGAEDMISAPLAEAVQQTLDNERQAILFLNRRGFATFVVCKSCGHVFQCEHCSVSLTHHRGRDRLVCHYCGYATATPTKCPACSAEQVRMLGVGTERIERALHVRFPTARIARLDRDTAAGKGLRQTLHAMNQREVDILIGTQMVTKGHDFPHVTLVGVLCADTGLHFPDFRAAERTFQLLTQVAGRAGRGEDIGRVVIQTYNPDHPAIRLAQNHDYEAFFAHELRVREDLAYPPCGALAALHLDGEDGAEVGRQARRLAEKAQPWVRERTVELLGPTEAPLQRLKGRTRWILLIKAASRAPVRAVVAALFKQGQELPGSVRLTVDIDPLQML